MLRVKRYHQIIVVGENTNNGDLYERAEKTALIFVRKKHDTSTYGSPARLLKVQISLAETRRGRKVIVVGGDANNSEGGSFQ